MCRHAQRRLGAGGSVDRWPVCRHARPYPYVLHPGNRPIPTREEVGHILEIYRGQMLAAPQRWRTVATRLLGPSTAERRKLFREVGVHAQKPGQSGSRHGARSLALAGGNECLDVARSMSGRRALEGRPACRPLNGRTGRRSALQVQHDERLPLSAVIDLNCFRNSTVPSSRSMAALRSSGWPAFWESGIRISSCCQGRAA